MKRFYRKELWQRVGKANEDFSLVEEGDRIAIGLSGGKDSLTLVWVMKEWQRFAPVNFEIMAITLDMGWEGDLSPLREFCDSLEVPLHIEATKIGPIVFEARRENNPCSLCAKLRRGALHKLAKDRGCNKVALGHHLDDALETLLLCMSFESRIKTFKPRTYLDRQDITLIRPLIYVEEQTVKNIVKRLNLPVVQNPCPANGCTKRQDMKGVVEFWRQYNPKLRENLLGALRNGLVWPR